jgi:hypothetical protein
MPAGRIARSSPDRIRCQIDRSDTDSIAAASRILSRTGSVCDRLVVRSIAQLPRFTCALQPGRAPPSISKMQNSPQICRQCSLPIEMERHDVGRSAVAWDGVRWIVVACAGEVRRQTKATDATYDTPATHDAGSRVSRLTTRIVNAFRTNPATQLFQVVSGGRDRIGRHAFSTCRERNSSLAAANPRREARMPSAHAAIKDAARRSAVPPAGRHP